MPDFNSHLVQAKRNLRFIEDLCSSHFNNYWDWKVTACFYTAVHLIDAHIASKMRMHYTSHKQVDTVISFKNDLSPCRLDQDTYLAYASLQILSRRSRYLINMNNLDNKETAQFTYSVHLKKAIKKLDLLMDFIDKEYNTDFHQTKIKCIELKNVKLNYFIVLT